MLSRGRKSKVYSICTFFHSLAVFLHRIVTERGGNGTHRDVVAYVKPGTTPAIGVITDGVNLDLVEFMELLIDEYATIPYGSFSLSLSFSHSS